MPFGLSNVLASFLDYINKILSKMYNIFMIVYLDDFLIYISNTKPSHVKAVW